MEATRTAKVFGALGHEGRLAIFCLLASAGAEGVPAGEIARRTGQVQNTTSANLSVLANAGLISPRRQGRSIFYAVSETAFDDAVAFVASAFREERARDAFGERDSDAA
jgi:DNA-binding transcriptional ArsR family regulator